MATEQKNTQKKKMSKARQKRERQKKILTVEFIILVLLLGVLFVWLKFGKLDFTALKNIATNSLDPETKERVIRLVDEVCRSKTLFMITHDAKDAEALEMKTRILAE